MPSKLVKPLPPKTALPTAEPPPVPKEPKEFGGPKGPEPTRFGDWEHKGRCLDF